MFVNGAAKLLFVLRYSYSNIFLSLSLSEYTMNIFLYNMLYKFYRSNEIIYSNKRRRLLIIKLSRILFGISKKKFKIQSKKEIKLNLF